MMRRGLLAVPGSMGCISDGAGGDGFVGQLDGYPWAELVGYKRLLSIHTDPLFRVIRLSDSAEMDVHPAGGADGKVDVAALKAWRDAAGASTLELVKAYDQTGNGRDYTPPGGARPSLFTQVATTNIPAWECIDTSNESILSDNNGPTSATKTVYLFAGDRGSSSDCIMEYGPGNLIGGASNNLYFQLFGTTGFDAEMSAYLGSTSAGANWAEGRYNNGYNGGTVLTLLPAAGSAANLSIKAYHNGLAKTVSSFPGGSGNSAGPFPAAKWRVGARSDGLGSQTDIYAFGVMESDQSSSGTVLSGLVL